MLSDQRIARPTRLARLTVYRDIGILPYDEWEAFSEIFPAQYHGPIIGHAPARGDRFTPPPEARHGEACPGKVFAIGLGCCWALAASTSPASPD